MQVRPAGRAGGQRVPVLRPQRGQDQHRGAGRVAQQLPQPSRDPLAHPAVRHVEVELGLVEPHHRPRPDPRQLRQRRTGPGRVYRMPHPPRRLLVTQQAQRLPAGPGLARGRSAHQHRHSAAPGRGRLHQLAQHLVMPARHVHRQIQQPGRCSLGLHRPVHLQRKRIDHLRQQPPRQRPQPGLRHHGIGGRASRWGGDVHGDQLGGDHRGELLRIPAAQVHRDHVSTAAPAAGCHQTGPAARTPAAPAPPGSAPSCAPAGSSHGPRTRPTRTPPRRPSAPRKRPAVPRRGTSPTARSAHQRRRSSAPPAPSASRRPG